MTVRDAITNDATAISRIYNHYVLHDIATFDLIPVPDSYWTTRIAAADTNKPFLVLEEADGVTGYAYATDWKSRCAYDRSGETSVYLAPNLGGAGRGLLLMEKLLLRLKKADLHTVIAGVSLPNPASVALHEKLGYQRTGTFREVGFKFGRWIDVGYWQRFF